MTLQRAAFDDACPVSDDLLGTFYRTSAEGLPALVKSVPPATRAMLALFCYRRAHLHEMSLVIAATCDERDLAQAGGTLGSVLFRLSQDRQPKVAAPAGRATITLSTKPLREFAPLDNEVEEEFAVATAAPVPQFA